jgi:hypothetical protein
MELFMHRSPTFRSFAGAIGVLLISHVSTAWAHDSPEPDKASQGATVGRPGADKQGRKAGDVQSKASGFQNPGAQRGFNPQPEPPGKQLGQLPSAPANAKQ